MGYYPATLFKGGLAVEVDWVGCGGEVYSSLPNPEQTQDQMGSGYQAAGGWAKSAYLRNLRVQTDMNGTMIENNGNASTDAAVPGGADPYTIALDMESGSSWDSYFFVGGPGGSSTLLSKSGNPLVRLTGSSPSVTLHA